MKTETLSECIQDGSEGVYLDVGVSPNSSRTEITGVNRWRNNLEISIEAEPSGGEANRVLIDFLSDALEISKERVKIAKGKTSKKKRIFIHDMDRKGLKEKISKKSGESI